MKNVLQVITADGTTIELPLRHQSFGDSYPELRSDDESAPPVVGEEEYFADHPSHSRDLEVTEVRFYSEALEKPVRFIVESFTLSDGEEGHWAMTITRRDYGPPDYELEYYMTKQNCKVLREPLCFQWDNEKEEIVVN